MNDCPSFSPAESSEEEELRTNILRMLTRWPVVFMWIFSFVVVLRLTCYIRTHHSFIVFSFAAAEKKEEQPCRGNGFFCCTNEVLVQ